MSQLFQRDFRPPGKTQTGLEAAAREHADTSNQPRKAAHANSLPLLLLPDCSVRGKSKNAIDLNYSWTAETRNYHFPHVFNVCGCLYVNNTWKQRNPMPVETPPRGARQQKPLPAHTAPPRTTSTEPKVSARVPTRPHLIPKTNGAKPRLQLLMSPAEQEHDRGEGRQPLPILVKSRQRGQQPSPIPQAVRGGFGGPVERSSSWWWFFQRHP